MKLNRIQLPLLGLSCRYRAVGSMGDDLESGRRLFNIIVMAHPTHGFLRNMIKQPALSVCRHFDLTILADRRLAYTAS